MADVVALVLAAVVATDTLIIDRLWRQLHAARREAEKQDQ